MNINNKKFFCSWSGGKDSCLSLYYAMEQDGIPKKLLTMLIENGERSRSHGLPLNIIQKQAELLRIPLLTCATSWGDYEENFIKLLKDIKEEDINYGVFGDIDIEDHRNWVRKVCEKANIKQVHPIWKKSRRELVEEFLDYDFEAIIVAVNENKLSKEFLGRKLDKKIINEFEQIGIDPAGENGEYHTAAIGGPIFTDRINYELQNIVKSNGYWFQNISLVKENF